MDLRAFNRIVSFQTGFSQYRLWLMTRQYNNFYSDVELYLAAVINNDVTVFKQVLAALSQNSKSAKKILEAYPIQVAAIAFASDKIMEFFLDQFYSKKENKTIPFVKKNLGFWLYLVTFPGKYFDKIFDTYKDKSAMYSLCLYYFASGKGEFLLNQLKKLPKKSLAFDFDVQTPEKLVQKAISGNETTISRWANHFIKRDIIMTNTGFTASLSLRDPDALEDRPSAVEYDTGSETDEGSGSESGSTSDDDSPFLNWKLRVADLGVEAFFDLILERILEHKMKRKIQSVFVPNKWLNPVTISKAHNYLLETRVEYEELRDSGLLRANEAKEVGTLIKSILNTCNKLRKRGEIKDDKKEELLTKFKRLYEITAVIESRAADRRISMTFDEDAIFARVNVRNDEDEIVEVDWSTALTQDHNVLLNPVGYREHTPTKQGEFFGAELMSGQSMYGEVTGGYRRCKFNLTGVLDPEGTTYDYDDKKVTPLFFDDRRELAFYPDVDVNPKKHPGLSLINSHIRASFGYETLMEIFNRTGVAVLYGKVEVGYRAEPLPYEFWESLRSQGLMEDLLTGRTSGLQVGPVWFRRYEEEFWEHNLYMMALGTLPYSYYTEEEKVWLANGLRRIFIDLNSGEREPNASNSFDKFLSGLNVRVDREILDLIYRTYIERNPSHRELVSEDLHLSSMTFVLPTSEKYKEKMYMRMVNQYRFAEFKIRLCGDGSNFSWIFQSVIPVSPPPSPRANPHTMGQTTDPRRRRLRERVLHRYRQVGAPTAGFVETVREVAGDDPDVDLIIELTNRMMGDDSDGYDTDDIRDFARRGMNRVISTRSAMTAETNTDTSSDTDSD